MRREQRRYSAAWISGALPDELRRTLEAEFPKHWKPPKRAAFIAAAGELLDERSKLGLPHVLARAARRSRHARAAKLLRGADNALDRYDRIDWQLLDQRLALKRAAFTGRDAKHIVKTLASTVDEMLAHNPHLRPPAQYRGAGRQITVADNSFVRELAVLWARIDGKQPSAAENGSFAKVLKVLLPDHEFGQKRLEKLVKVPGFEPPPRGPRGRR